MKNSRVKLSQMVMLAQNRFIRKMLLRKARALLKRNSKYQQSSPRAIVALTNLL